MNRRDRRAAAKTAKTQSSTPPTPAALFEAGLRHLEAGRHLDAQICCQQALAADPTHADSLYLMGLLAAHSANHGLAVEWLARAVRQSPKPHYLAALGSALQSLGRREEACQALEAAVRTGPGDAAAWMQYANILMELGRAEDAIVGFEKVLALDPRQWDAACRSGILQYQSGRLEQALACFDICNALKPDHAPTLYMRAVFLRDLKRYDEALADNMRAHALDPGNAETCNNIGHILKLTRRHEDALSWFDKALALRPDFVEALYNRAAALARLGRCDEGLAACARLTGLGLNATVDDGRLGLLLCELGRPEQALVHLDRAVERQPNDTTVLHGRALALRRMGRLEQCLADHRRAHALDPADADTCNNIGAVLQALGRDEEALPWFDRANERRADFGEALLNRTASLTKLGRRDEAYAVCRRLQALGLGGTVTDWNLAVLLADLDHAEEALPYFDRCVEQQPNDANVLRRRALARRSLNRFEEALADNRRAHAIEPDDAETCSRIGNLLVLLDREQEALPWLDRALSLRPDLVDALFNKASALVGLHRLDEAFAIHARIKALDPDNAFAALALAHLHLLAGNFAEGWAGREARWRLPSLPIAHATFDKPIWLGDGAIAGKTILVYSDEGLGDAIQFARYVPMLAERGARVILVVQPALLPLLSDLAGVAQCLPASGGTLPPFDLYCPMMSLPLAFGTLLDTIPARTPYLPPAPVQRLQAWKDRLGPHHRLRVGLVWSGNPKHRNDHNRSIPLRQLARVLDVDATFVSLQKDVRDADRRLLTERPDIVDLTSHLADFGDTAALVQCLDLVITVDTSVAHLAGALGRPTWILLPHSTDCRWLLDREDSPWYPTARLFRQDAARDYAGVIERMRGELTAVAAAFRTATHERG